LKVINCHIATVFEHHNIFAQLNDKWLQEAATATMADDALLDGDGLRSAIKQYALIYVWFFYSIIKLLMLTLVTSFFLKPKCPKLGQSFS
jgi:hypothetical protein